MAEDVSFSELIKHQTQSCKNHGFSARYIACSM